MPCSRGEVPGIRLAGDNLADALHQQCRRQGLADRRAAVGAHVVAQRDFLQRTDRGGSAHEQRDARAPAEFAERANPGVELVQCVVGHVDGDVRVRGKPCPGLMCPSRWNHREAILRQPSTGALVFMPKLDGAVARQDEHQAIVPVPRHGVGAAASERRMAVVGGDQQAFVGWVTELVERSQHGEPPMQV